MKSQLFDIGPQKGCGNGCTRTASPQQKYAQAFEFNTEVAQSSDKPTTVEHPAF